jgi:hypothetical protein
MGRARSVKSEDSEKARKNTVRLARKSWGVYGLGKMAPEPTGRKRVDGGGWRM